MTFYAVDKEKLSRLIDRRSAEIDQIWDSRSSPKNWNQAIVLTRALAHHDALVDLYNCLEKRESIWSSLEAAE